MADGADKQGIYDYYLVYSEKPGDSGDSTDPDVEPELGAVGVSKELTSNNDGTYNLEVGASIPAETKEIKNAVNVVVVFGTSSSMMRSTVDPSLT